MQILINYIFFVWGQNQPTYFPERRRFVELHKKTGRLEEENTEYNVLLERFSTEIIEHPERFTTLASGDAAQSGASPVKMEPPTPDEHGGDNEEEETTLKPPG